MVYTSPPCEVCGKRSKVYGLDHTDVAFWRNGALIQKVWPDMTPDEREIIKTGTHPDCWDSLFDDD